MTPPDCVISAILMHFERGTLLHSEILFFGVFWLRLSFYIAEIGTDLFAVPLDYWSFFIQQDVSRVSRRVPMQCVGSHIKSHVRPSNSLSVTDAATAEY